MYALYIVCETDLGKFKKSYIFPTRKETYLFAWMFRSLHLRQLLTWTFMFQAPHRPPATAADYCFSNCHSLPCPLPYSGNIKGLIFFLDKGQQINEFKYLNH